MAENVPKALTPSAFTPFGGEFDQLFNRMVRAWSLGFLEPATNGQPRALRSFEHAPKVEVQENGKSYTITVELPGVEQKDVKVLVEDDVLTVSGEKHVERSDEKTHYSERSYGRFERRVALPPDVDDDACQADFKDGVLTVTLPRSFCNRAVNWSVPSASNRGGHWPFATSNSAHHFRCTRTPSSWGRDIVTYSPNACSV